MAKVLSGLSGAISGAFASTGEWDLFAKLLVVLALLFLAMAAFIRLGLRGRTLRDPAWGPLLRSAVLHGLILGVVGLLLGAFRYEQVMYLSGPWLLELYLVVCLVWFGWKGFQLRQIPSALRAQKELERKQQWMKPNLRRRKKRR